MQSVPVVSKIGRAASHLLSCAGAAVFIIAAHAWLPSAHAQTEETFLSFVSEPGDSIGGGETRRFTPADSDFHSMASQDGREVAVSILPRSGGFWYLHMAAPLGQQLLPGVYEGATRWPFQAPSAAGLDLSGDGRGCNTLTGRFEVLEAVYAPFGYIERFHATFEQHCEGSTPALFGEINIVNPPPPPPLSINIVIDRNASLRRISGVANVGGTISCSAATTVFMFGTLAQRASRFDIANGPFGLSLPCTTTPARWSVQVSGSDTPFNSGPAEVNVTANALDPNLGIQVTVQQSALIQLKPSQR